MANSNPSIPRIRFRRCDYAVMIFGVGFLLFVAMLVDAYRPRGESELAFDLVHELALTDLALFTEARFTRHPSQSDLHAPFQDAPMAFDLFPSGSLIGPQTPQFIQNEAGTSTIGKAP